MNYEDGRKILPFDHLEIRDKLPHVSGVVVDNDPTRQPLNEPKRSHCKNRNSKPLAKFEPLIRQSASREPMSVVLLEMSVRMGTLNNGLHNAVEVLLGYPTFLFQVDKRVTESPTDKPKSKCTKD